MEHKFLIHDLQDNVGVAVADIAAGEEVKGAVLTDWSFVGIKAVDDVLLSHKIAISDLEKGAEVIKYGTVIGVATKPIRKGGNVHVHNVRSVRWGNGKQ